MRNILQVLLFVVLAVPSVFAKLELSGLSLQPLAPSEPVQATLTREVSRDESQLTFVLSLQMAPDIHLYSSDSLFFALTITDSQNVRNCAVVLPEHHMFKNFDGSMVGVYVGGQVFKITTTVAAAPWSIGGELHYQACDSRMCFTPRSIIFRASSDGALSAEVAGSTSKSLSINQIGATPQDVLPMLSSFTIKGMRGGYLNAVDFITFLDKPDSGSDGNASPFDNRGLLAIVLLILLGGIALNLTPCVLPMIPITIAVIGAGAQAKSRSRGMLSGGIYGLAMALTYGVLGLIVVLTGSRFGVINASPGFNIAIAGIFIVMALAMFDLIQIDFTRFRKAGGESKERGKLLTVFVMGIVASLLAGACVAPVVIAVVLYAGKLYAGGEVAGLVLPFLLGIGMALPWPFAGAGLSLMPKPGKWMVWVKYLFGIFILGMALYYGATGVSLLKKSTPPKQVTETTAITAGEATGQWSHNLAEALVTAQKENKPVIIDFWATWCKNCKAMDATTFKDANVINKLQGYVAVKYQAEKPDEKATKALLDHFGIVGLPSYVVVEPVR